MSGTLEYSQGYQAGVRKGKSDIECLKKELAWRKASGDERRERVYMQSLGLVLKHCSGWKINDRTINDAEGYCALAKIFTDNSIAEIEK